ncbi:MAG TPA: ABC transporter permease [Chloroflexota bacterium]|nr:ABC transporter permease [Chloroflexota bacterium]
MAPCAPDDPESVSVIAFIVRRLILLIPVLIGVSLLTFLISRIIPADPARMIAGPHAGPAQVEAVRHAYGLDRPLWQQYTTYMGGLLHGDLGTSFHTQRPVRDDLGDFLPATLELTLAAMAFTIVVGILLGVLAATNRDGWIDNLTRLLSVTGVSMPVFWLGLMLQLLLYYRLGWLPAGGRLDTGLKPPPHLTGMYIVDGLVTGHWSLAANAAWHLILPALVLSVGSLAVVTRMMRASVLEVMGRDYIRTARAKGLARSRVVWRHALRNALLPTITVAGLQTGYLLSGAILVEAVFSWSGIGLYAAQSIISSDYNAIMSVTLVIAALFILVNLLVDLLYAVADPRIHYR